MPDGKSQTTAAGKPLDLETLRAKAATWRQLDNELRRRLWALYDAAKMVSERGDAMSGDEWAAFHIAVAAIPESQHGR